MPAAVKKDLRVTMPEKFLGGSHIDLRQQLVIWKRVIFLLDNMSISPVFCKRLVDKGIFNSEMMRHVQSQTFDIERKLMVLSLLGKYGTDVYEKFLAVLEETSHGDVVKELRKTEKFIYFGEMLPPCFYYFMSLSEFLNKYPHIALKLGEDEKHILKLFIEGKISMANRVKDEHIQREIKQIEKKHEDEITKMVQHIQEINMQHVEECNRLKGRIRAKVYQIHDREQLHKRLRKQITVLENYQAENMNATVSVEQCRKIVRSIIGEARILKHIADEREDVVPLWEQNKEEEERKKEEEEKKKKKKKKKKEFKNLRNERLMYIGDRVNMRWRELGDKMGLTLNRLDMIEMDSPFAKGEDQMCFAMLKAWRDEDKGKLVDLVEGLRAINRHDLAMVVMPLNTKRVAIVKDAADTEGVTADKTDGEDTEGGEDGEDGDEVDPDQVKVEIKGGKKKKGGGKKEDNNKKAVPKLPKIKKK